MPIHGYPGGVISATSPTVSVSSATGIWTLEKQLYYQGQGVWPGPFYPISRSVRLRASASAYFSRTPATASNRTTWTWSAWVKRGDLSRTQGLFGAGVLGNNANFQAYWDSNNALYFQETVQNISNQLLWTSTPIYRDTSAWYHVVVAMDTTQATAANRLKVYVNGAEIAGSFSVTPGPSQATSINNNVAQYLGAAPTNSASLLYMNGYLTEINFIDGQALTPTSFGEFSSTTGVWNPKAYTGTYGTNGFYLNFSDNTSPASATTIGKDYSGNGNNWTPTGISVTNVTAPNTNDSMVDSPSNYGVDTGAGGEVRGNYAVLSVPASSTWTFSNANMTGYGGTYNCYFSMPIIGKMYFEVYCSGFVGGGQVGFVKNATIALASVGYNQAGYYGVNYAPTNSYWVNGTNDATTHGTVTNQTMKFAVDGATGKVWIGSGSTWFGSGDPAAGTNPAFTLSLSTGDLIYPMLTSQQVRDTFTINTGQQQFGNAAPSGFKAMCTQNMTTAAISNGANYMAASTYTGTGASLTVSNAVNSISFQPDLVWIKSRSAATDHKWTDSVRGTTKGLISNTTGAETTDTTGLTAFGTTGFTVGANTTYNNSGATYVGWQWKASGSTVSNTTGSITSTVSANTTAGFSILTYTGNGTVGATVGHGLGATPGMVIVKSRSATADWPVKILPYMTGGQRLELSTTNAITTEAAGSGSLWNATNPDGAVITLGNQAMTNTNGTTYVAYCFAPITGYSAFSSYTGNGSTDGPFVYCGFRPRWVMVKRTDAAGARWAIADTSRSPYNVGSQMLYADAANAEDTGSGATYDIVSNGFKIRAVDGNWNTSGGTYIYAAFAENPFKISRAR